MNAPLSGHVIVALPAYNEAEGLPQLLEDLDHVLAGSTSAQTYVIVDDGSTDGTADVIRSFAESHRVLTLRHEPNAGLGPTIRDALQLAVDNASPEDAVLTMDADNTHPPQIAPGMLQLLRDGNDIVIASRYRKGARIVGLAAHREWLSIGASWLFRLLFPVRGLRDYTCGYRVYRAAVLRRGFATYGSSFVDQVGFQCMADILLKLTRFNPRIAEVPLVLRYDRKEGRSKMKVVRTVANTMCLLLRRRLGIWN